VCSTTVTSDVKFHEIFCLEIFHEKNIVKFLKYFMKYFKAKNFMKFYISNQQ